MSCTKPAVRYQVVCSSFRNEGGASYESGFPPHHVQGLCSGEWPRPSQPTTSPDTRGCLLIERICLDI